MYCKGQSKRNNRGFGDSLKTVSGSHTLDIVLFTLLDSHFDLV